ncbi:MAG: DUF6754 domain-containing protein [Bacillota bacterium]
MSFITEGQTVALITQLVFCITLLYYISIGRKGGEMPNIRRVSGLDALDESIGRATEMGRPVHYSPGISGLDEAQTLASLAILDYVARKTAHNNVPLIMSNRIVLVQALSEQIIRDAYAGENRLDSFNPDNVRYLTDSQFGYATGVTGILRREKVATSILIGAFWAESLIFAQTGYEIGAIQIAGTANTHQIPFFVAACDYCLIGDEMYAASAYISREPVLVASLVVSDYFKMAGIAVLLVGLFFMLAGSSAIVDLIHT